MSKKLSNRMIVKNAALSIGAQIISLGTSLVINLIVPKFINEYQYAFWQTYVLYGSYVGILHFGLLDGIVLRYSQYDYDELSKNAMNAHFRVLSVLLSVIAALGILVSNGRSKEGRVILILVAISVITKNIFMFCSFSFQITNRIKDYTQLIISQRLFYGLGTIACLVCGFKQFWVFCIVDLSADIVGFLSTLVKNKEIYFTKGITIDEIKNVFISIKSGIALMISNFSSNFIIGSTKICVQNFWDVVMFGQVSFSFSITNLFLTFVTAISVVLFPSIKRMETEKLPDFYKCIRTIISPVLIGALFMYFPGCILLELWLPNYVESLRYAGILLPIIVYSTKVSLLTNNYLKAFRKEKEMLALNLSCIGIELIGLFFMGYIMRNLEAILLWTVIITMIRFVGSEMLVEKAIGNSFKVDNIIEAHISALFLIGLILLSRKMAFLMFGIVVCVYIVYIKSRFLASIQLLKAQDSKNIG